MNENTTNPAALAAKFIHQTNRHVFLTGKAGTGKTTFLREITSKTYKNAVVAAPTGIAAINANGVTLHSLFQLPFGSFIPDNTAVFSEHLKINTPKDLFRNLQLNGNKRKFLQELELLIIDEVSMLRADLLDAIDTVLKGVRRKSHLSFGGVQVLFIGDLLQLPPVVKDQEWNHLKKYYSTPYFFDARVLQNNKPVYIELDKIYRQSDDRFITLLNHLRNNEVLPEDIETLNSYYKPDFNPKPEENFIHLTTHNYKADKLNSESLHKLTGESFFYDAEIKDDFSEYSYPIESRMELKRGAQVMFIKNDPSGARRFFNGKIGVVSFLGPKEIKVKFSDGNEVSVEKYQWQNIKYKLNTDTNEIEENIAGTFTHYPIKLAWAITVHKSQGLTFEKAIIDIGDAFAPGQVYVALSRLTSLNGLVLSSRLQTGSLQVDEKISEFSSEKPEENILQNEFEKSADDFFKKYLSECFDFTRIENAFIEHLSGYTHEEKKSPKKKYRGQIEEIKTEISHAKSVADKFLKQLHSLLQENDKQKLVERIGAAKDHFEKAIKTAGQKMKSVLEDVSTEKRVRSYSEELAELDRLVFKQLQLLHKALGMAKAHAGHKDFIAGSINTDEINREREESLKEKKGKKDKTKEKKGNKPQKGDTYKLSYDLYKSGKTIEEIAAERSLTPGTIAGHLAKYVEKGLIPPSDFVPSDKIEKIIEASKKAESTHFGPIKNELGDEYS